jgi:hypothetical protein
MVMSEFSGLFLDLGAVLDDPEAFASNIGARLEPDLLDKLHAFAAARNETLPHTVMAALQLFMFSAAEDAWRDLSNEMAPADDVGAAPLNIILERFMAIALDPARQKLLEGPEPASLLNQFRRLREE